jgi:hypothetical protein
LIPTAATNIKNKNIYLNIITNGYLRMGAEANLPDSISHPHNKTEAIITD